MRLTRHSIGTAIFVAFFAMGTIVGVIGLCGYLVLSKAGNMVTGTYDGPLMAINYARAASVDFVEMQQATLRRRLANPAERPAIDRAIDTLSVTFLEDLGVAQIRSEAADERVVIAQIRGFVGEWQAIRHRATQDGASAIKLYGVEKRIMDRFDMLIELNADHSFIGRREAVWAIRNFKYLSLGVTLLALLASMAITWSLTRRIMRPLGSAVHVADRIADGQLQTPIPEGSKDETGILLNSMRVMQDNIRSMMERETARAQSAEMRLFHALQSSREGVLLIDPSGRILHVNDQVRAFFPNIASKIRPGAAFSSIAALAATELADNGQIPTLWELGLSRNTGVAGGAERRLLDGRWIRITGSAAADGAFIFFLTDLTEIKEREESLRKAKLAAEAANAAKSRFLNNMSHELRTPLNAVIGFSEMISGQVFGSVGDGRYRDYATDILRSGRHLLDIINSVLELTRSDAGKMTLQKEAVDLRYILRDCARMLEPMCSAGGLTLSNTEPSQPVLVAGEKAKLRQIFLNLLSNAVKFTDPGGRIAIAVNQSTQTVTVEIRDTGIGMSGDDITVALTPFGQVDDRLARRYEGAGLGLPLAKSLVDLHDGRLEIESAPKLGTVVRVHLPRAQFGEGEGTTELTLVSNSTSHAA
ncbi:MAG TPA: ATP-binding protein [Rhizomicrobium sp.]|jgi:signal transduction histidine kinase/HAMP domain-containing protein